jgi:NTE family protein
VVGALYAAGLNGFELQKVGMELDEATLADWSFPQPRAVQGRGLAGFRQPPSSGRNPWKSLGKTFAAVATELKNGEMVAVPHRQHRHGRAGLQRGARGVQAGAHPRAGIR